MNVRDITEADLTPAALLLGQLGYPTEPEALPARLAAMQREGLSAVWVAEREGEIIGLATAHVFAAVHADAKVAYLSALVVAADSRRTGAGRALVEHAQTWARSRGAVRMSISVGAHRSDAHAFYPKLGFERTGYRYAKPLVT